MLSSPSSQSLGKAGELLVADYLQERGFKIIARNYTTAHGEVDLIVQKEDVIAFVEVKMRKKNYFDLTEVITKSKQKKIAAAAKDYMSRHTHPFTTSFRFDVALVEGKTTPTILYIPSAFNHE